MSNSGGWGWGVSMPPPQGSSAPAALGQHRGADPPPRQRPLGSDPHGHCRAVSPQASLHWYQPRFWAHCSSLGFRSLCAHTNGVTALSLLRRVSAGQSSPWDLQHPGCSWPFAKVYDQLVELDRGLVWTVHGWLLSPHVPPTSEGNAAGRQIQGPQSLSLQSSAWAHGHLLCVLPSPVPAIFLFPC